MRVNNELVAETLSFGADIEVLQPQHRRQLIVKSTTPKQVQY